VPSRIVNGYAQGDFDEETNSYRVRASNAHTWVEVYFPNYGWIQFEPTASIPVVVRQQGDGSDLDQATFSGPELDLEALEDLRGAEDESRFGDTPEIADENNAAIETWRARIFTWQTAVAVIILIAAILLILAANEINKRVESDVTRSYTRLESWAGWLGLRFKPAKTPYERADLLLSEVPEGSTQVRNLTQQYVLREFSPEHENEATFNPKEEWRILRPIFLRKSIQKRLEQWRKKPDI